ncbi:B3 domain-containing protein REM10-like [Cornus florida]|uniref:B3 domain-containing protein REM10-like n=1 Tax=Cornus florida TaxID=4283 RepID=UPI00289713F7|nr:B3 domain-containing protein REM10-like [Cornus florida]
MATPLTIPPTEPHFFKPLLPGFHHELLIPISFFKYLNNGEKCEQALLRSRGLGKYWAVKVKGRRLEDGWTDFAQTHELSVGDFLVFRHEGDMVFDVTVFKPSGCEREYTSLDISTTDHVDSWKLLQKSNSESADSIKDYLSSGSEKTFNYPSMARPKAEASPFTLGDHPSFVSTLRRYGIEFSMLYIPVKFAKQNGLINRSCEMILRCQQRSWKVTLQKKSDGSQVYIRRGWRDFCIANGLKEGDTFRIELINNGKVPIMDFHSKFNLF